MMHQMTYVRGVLKVEKALFRTYIFIKKAFQVGGSRCSFKIYVSVKIRSFLTINHVFRPPKRDSHDPKFLVVIVLNIINILKPN